MNVKKKQTTKVTIYEAAVIAIILLFPSFLSLTSSVKTDSRFFPSVNVNCPFQKFISGLKFYRHHQKGTDI